MILLDSISHTPRKMSRCQDQGSQHFELCRLMSEHISRQGTIRMTEATLRNMFYGCSRNNSYSLIGN